MTKSHMDCRTSLVLLTILGAILLMSCGDDGAGCGGPASGTSGPPQKPNLQELADKYFNEGADSGVEEELVQHLDNRTLTDTEVMEVVRLARAKAGLD